MAAEASITKEAAIAIAVKDAKTFYSNLDKYSVSATLMEDGWHVVFELKDKLSPGGGAQYVLDRNTGRILKRRLEQ